MKDSDKGVYFFWYNATERKSIREWIKEPWSESPSNYPEYRLMSSQPMDRGTFKLFMQLADKERAVL